MNQLLEDLIKVMTLERLEMNLFRGQSRDIGTPYVFGGQVLGQALSAAQQTTDPSREAHSLHGYFLRAGDIDAPIVYSVERTRDGGSFSSRRVVAIQHGQPILDCSVSFQAYEKGVEHQMAMPEVPMPEDVEPLPPLPAEELAKLPEKARRWLDRQGPFEFRHVWPRDELRPAKRPPYQHIWFRLTAPVDDEQALHRALLAYASDFHLIGTATLPHGLSLFTHNIQMASLDHAIWFHRPFRADDWLLFEATSGSLYDSRGLTQGRVFSLDGALVASVAQEVFLRHPRPTGT